MSVQSHRARAFTLIELLIVITIIGILAAALLPRITSGPAKARDAQRQADLQQITTALVLYANDNSGLYPAIGALKCIDAVVAATLTPYITSLPTDPQGNGPKTCTTGYLYRPLDGSTSFILGALFESTTGSGEGQYVEATFALTTPTTLNYSGQLAIPANIDRLCSTADCSGGIMYVTGI